MKKEFIPNSKAFSKDKKKKTKIDKGVSNSLELKSSNPFVKTKRVGRGRGSKIGKTCGRGMKGQKARNTVKKGFEGGQMPLHRRLPKFGFNSHKKNDFFVLNLYQLEKIDVLEISNEVLFKNKLIPKLNSKVKLLGHGEVDKSFNLTLNAFSKSAKLKVENAGGSCNTTPQ